MDQVCKTVRSCPCPSSSTFARNAIIHLKRWSTAARKPNAPNVRARNWRNNFRFLPCRPRVPQPHPLRWERAGVAAIRAAPALARCPTWIDCVKIPASISILGQPWVTFGTCFRVTAVSFDNHEYAVPSQESNSNGSYGSSSQSTCRRIPDGAHLGCRCQVHALHAACSSQKHQRSRGGVAWNDPSSQGRRDPPPPA